MTALQKLTWFAWQGLIPPESLVAKLRPMTQADYEAIALEYGLRAAAEAADKRHGF